MDIKKITITDTDEAVLKNELPDIQAWVQGAVDGKINGCKGRMINQWRPILNADDSVESIPADDDKLIAVIVARDDYKDMETQNAEIAASLPK